jgi:hypothetical protein
MVEKPPIKIVTLGMVNTIALLILMCIYPYHLVIKRGWKMPELNGGF